MLSFDKLPYSNRGKFFFKRLFQNRFSFAFFVVIFFQASALAVLHAFLFTIDRNASQNIQSPPFVLPPRTFVKLEGPIFKVCNGTNLKAPAFDGTVECPVLAVNLEISPNLSISDGALASSAAGLAGPISFPLNVSQPCDTALLWALEFFQNSERDDLAFVALQAWLLLISILSIFKESTPDLIGALATTLLSTIWSMFAIKLTATGRSNFQTFVIQGACATALEEPGRATESLLLIGSAWDERLILNLVILCFNLIGLVASVVIARKMIKIFEVQRLAHAGSTEHINGILNVALALSASFTLSSFVLVTSMCLWINQLFNGGAIEEFSLHTPLYKALYISTLLLLIPWLALGNIAIKHENRRIMCTFLGICFVIVCCWSIMFYSIVYRYTFLTWPFFATMTVTSFVLMISTFIIGIACYRNFGKGLAHYLHVQRVLVDSDFASEYFTHDPRKPTIAIDPETPALAKK
ncbi:hypothetical protein SISSUDRAFT_1128729 [Sistotremastrum suecicum HHB10207 ss-3]|uniref:Uncharacterized protein n=1 Tax=Sistotremastrum suecicum HHB10207 ss-3 TaxID=1314776 RepID=A0A166DI60_9AGAM|nr:hypothetical protein SISSUDRAFT_1128729 [Sistotremastrum suecicum HHB10207 ss-3]